MLKDSKGNVVGALSTGRDITEQNEAQAHVLENEQRFRLAMDATSDGRSTPSLACLQSGGK